MPQKGPKPDSRSRKRTEVASVLSSSELVQRMSEKPFFVGTSVRPQISLTYAWEVQNVYSFQATRQHPAKSSHFSAKVEVWQLGMYEESSDQQYFFNFNLSLCSSKVCYTNVHAELTFGMYFTKKLRFRLSERQVAELWNIRRQIVLERLKAFNSFLQLSKSLKKLAIMGH
jgi:hypothetical protein